MSGVQDAARPAKDKKSSHRGLKSHQRRKQSRRSKRKNKNRNHWATLGEKMRRHNKSKANAARATGFSAVVKRAKELKQEESRVNRSSDTKARASTLSRNTLTRASNVSSIKSWSVKLRRMTSGHTSLSRHESDPSVNRSKSKSSKQTVLTFASGGTSIDSTD